MTKEAREFDIVVYGATGYTGRLVAEYLTTHYAGHADAPKWAMAGRNQSKLEDVRDLIGAPKDTPLIVADASDPDSLTAMCKRTKVVLTTVGPYQLYGNELVEACAREGTDYTDLCGEPTWMSQMIEKHNDLAKASGARICFSSGFDSIPFDLGVMMLQKESKARFGKPATSVKGRVRAMQGGPSGGTVASMKETMKAVAKNPKLIGVLQSPFGLTPGFKGPSQPSGLIPEYDKDLGKWAAPFVMAVINTKNVHRTNFLLGHPYGEDFKYDEMMLTSAGEMGEKAAKAISDMAKNPFGSKPPAPGEGPTKEERENGFYDVVFLGETADGEKIKYGVIGKYDPGYGSTSRMIAETAIALLSCDADGGIGTPGSFLGESLVKRLQDNAEISFAVED
ncbi:saccharopine dehydrogenase NADP-binding domain-containing protein [Pontixanthobacter gangjinensis]|uniref:Saccharopine dehydrogenase n=1 Tax=Pontixanthobacter gangjinensis TaxID=1028742 RepID=A0A6I4SKM2_9SPHN|nr:saccharopine dehydrogenase NADP-binding domain-containing protein [Pontixanthobacter gangjinensis]MXO56008.1 saccharopine dehydrogenase [Pontixanthobacter gangjinensis]